MNKSLITEVTASVKVVSDHIDKHDQNDPILKDSFKVLEKMSVLVKLQNEEIDLLNSDVIELKREIALLKRR